MRKLFPHVPLCAVWLFPVFLQIGNGLRAQSIDFLFRTLTMEDGLADGWVHGSLMDSKGMMWFATHDGLSRYDGHHFKNYKYNKLDSLSIPGPVVMDVAEDSKGIFWLALNGIGLVRFDRESERFEAYSNDVSNLHSISHNAACCLYVDADDRVWVGTFDGGLNCFDPRTQRFERFSLPDGAFDLSQSFMLNSVRRIRPDPFDASKLWLASHAGICLFDTHTKALTRYGLDINGQPAFAVDVLPDSSGKVWVACENNGLLEFDVKTKSHTALCPPDQVKSVLRKSSTELWVGFTGKGVGIYDVHDQSWSYLTADNDTDFDILSNQVYHLFADRDERLWVHDQHEGISVLYGKGAKIRTPTTPDHVFYNLWGHKQFAFDAKKRKLYVASTGNDFVFCFEITDNGYAFSHTLRPSFSENSGYQTVDLVCNGSGQLNVLMKKNGLLAYFQTDSLFDVLVEQEMPLFKGKSLDDTEKVMLRHDPSGRLWAVFSTGLLGALSSSNETTRAIGQAQMPNFRPKLNEAFFDGKGNLWASSLENGVFCYNMDTGKEIHFPYSPKHGLDAWRIPSLGLMKNGKIWAGSSAMGIQEIDPALPPTQFMPTYDQTNVLPDDKIQSIQSDPWGTIWVATNRGLVRYDPNTETFRTFGREDGLSNMVLEYGVAVLPNGDAVLGQHFGFQFFSREAQLPSQIRKEVVLSKFLLNNRALPLLKQGEAYQKIVLKPNENYFSVLFSALPYDNPKDVSYRYQLRGYDDAWHYAAIGEAMAKFTNVPAGDYVFQVQAADAEGLWSEQITELELKVLPYWYWSNLAQLIYAFLAAAVVGGFASLWRRRVELQNELKIEKIEKENLAEVEQLKSDMLVQSERLLLNVLPADFAKELKEKGSVTPRLLPECSVLFLDICNFTDLCRDMPAQQLMALLTELFGAFDRIMERHGLERVKTIGDAYMAFSGMDGNGAAKAKAMVAAALEMQDFLAKGRQNEARIAIHARIGIHTGAAIAGVVGQHKFAFDIWGETVNQAARMESYGKPDAINLSAETYELVKQDFKCLPRDLVDVKGLGAVQMYFVED